MSVRTKALSLVLVVLATKAGADQVPERFPWQSCSHKLSRHCDDLGTPGYCDALLRLVSLPCPSAEEQRDIWWSVSVFVEADGEPPFAFRIAWLRSADVYLINFVSPKEDIFSELDEALREGTEGDRPFSATRYHWVELSSSVPQIARLAKRLQRMQVAVPPVETSIPLHGVELTVEVASLTSGWRAALATNDRTDPLVQWIWDVKKLAWDRLHRED